jgi:hypothetical protein
MRLAFCLLLLAASGVAFLILPNEVLNFPADAMPAFYALWRSGLESFAVPTVLLALGMMRSKLVKGASLAWGLWMASLSGWVAVALKELAPSATTWATLFSLAVFVVSLGVVVFSCVALTPKPKSEKKEPKEIEEAKTELAG